MQVEKESKSVGLEKEDALNQVRWRVVTGNDDEDGEWELESWRDCCNSGRIKTG